MLIKIIHLYVVAKGCVVLRQTIPTAFTQGPVVKEVLRCCFYTTFAVKWFLRIRTAWWLLIIYSTDRPEGKGYSDIYWKGFKENSNILQNT